MILTIGICDDNAIFVDELKSIVVSYMNKLSIHYKIFDYVNVEKLLKVIDQIDILFLDVGMPEMDGFEVAERIRQTNNYMVIIFITGYRDKVQMGFKYRAFRYLYKPIDIVEIENTLSELIDEWCKNKKLLLNNQLIDYKDIMYIESLGDGSTVLLENGQIKTSYSMKKWISILNNNFVQIHQTYIVNLWNVKKIENNKLYLTNDFRLPISARKKALVKKSFLDYVERHANYL